MKYTIPILLGGILTALVVVVLGLSGIYRTPVTTGSVMVGGEYFATTTGGTAVGALGAVTKILKPSPGVLGSVVLTALEGKTGSIELYDATTSNINLRTDQAATSTLLLALFDGNDLSDTSGRSSNGTYTFDVNFRYGLMYFGYGTVPSTTITFR